MTDEIPESKLGLVAWALKLTPKETIKFIHIIWVVAVTVAIAHICGWLVVFGFTSPFALAGDLASVQKNVRVGTQISLTRELRDDYNTLCGRLEPALRIRILAEVDALQAEFLDLTGHYYPPQPCPAVQ